MGDELDPGPGGPSIADIEPDEPSVAPGEEPVYEPASKALGPTQTPAAAAVPLTSSPPTHKLKVQDRRRLEFVLADLEESKRLLDQARSPSP
jgi:hypothetical protein